MEALLHENAIGTLDDATFHAIYTETEYLNLKQIKRNTFPENCHRGAAVNSLAIEQSDYRYLLSGCADSSIKLWDLRPSDVQEDEADAIIVKNEPYQNLATIPRREAHKFGVLAVKWWPKDSGLFLSASFDHSVNVWDTNNLSIVHTFDLNNRVYSIDVSAEAFGQYSSQALVAVGSDQPFIRLLDLRSASSAHTLPGHKGKTLAVAWHPLRSYLLASGGHDGEGKIWDIRRSKSCVARLDMTKTNARDARTDAFNLDASVVKAHSGPVNGLCWDGSGCKLFTAGNDDKIRVWDLLSPRAPPINMLVNFGPLTRNKYLQNLPIVLSPQGDSEVQYLIFPSDNGDVLVFRAHDGKLVSRLQRNDSRSIVRTASIVHAGPGTLTYYCGTMDGDIVTWLGELVAEYDDEDDNLSGSDEDDGAGESILSVMREALYDDPYFRMPQGSGKT